MYSVQNKYARFCKIADKYSEFITAVNNDCDLGKGERHIYLSGLINSLWQAWNDFWRAFWLANLFGGVDIRRGIIKPIPSELSSRSSESEALFYLLYILGRRKKPNGCIYGSYQEATWGDRMHIERITIDLKGTSNSLLSAMAIYGDLITHMQLVRNASIHLDRDNFIRAKNELAPYCINASGIKYPTDLLFSSYMSTGRVVYKEWIDNLKILITYT